MSALTHAKLVAAAVGWARDTGWTPLTEWTLPMLDEGDTLPRMRSPGRVDVLLVPVNAGAAVMEHRMETLPSGSTCWPAFWSRPGFVGVEVKATRSDFARALGSGQFDRYAAALSGLYVLTSPGVVRRGELPDGLGHLSLRTDGAAVVARRHPKFRPVGLSVEDVWRVLFRVCELHRDELRERDRVLHVLRRRRDLRRRLQSEVAKLEAAVGSAVDRTIRDVLGDLSD